MSHPRTSGFLAPQHKMTLQGPVSPELIQLDLTASNALHLSTQYNQVDIVLKLLERGRDVDLISPEGWTALHVASERNRPAIAEVLLIFGADTEIKRKGSTVLHIAASRGHRKIVKLLLKYNADAGVKRPDGKTPLHLAATHGRTDVICLLGGRAWVLEESCDDRGFTALHLACEKSYTQCIAELLSTGAHCDSQSTLGYTPLMIAAKYDHPCVANKLLAWGANIDAIASCGRSAVIFAAKSGSPDVLRSLISSVANLDVVAQDTHNALSTAIMNNNPETALILLEQRVRIDSHHGGHRNTALHLAVSRNQHEIMKALLGKGADLEACDAYGDTALQRAVERDRMETVKILLRNGAQLNKRNERTGETVLHTAVKCGLVSMTQALLAHGSYAVLLDLNNLRKRNHCPGLEDVDDADFETCKTLVESAFFTETEIRPPGRFQSSPTQYSGLDTENSAQVTTGIPNTSRARLSTNPIYEMNDQVAVESFITPFLDKVVHDGVKCAGPHCAGRSESLRGIRYKCTWCDAKDLCLTCVGSPLNDHAYWHPMIRCLLPTQTYAWREIDDDTRRTCVLSDPQGQVRSEDVSHIVYAGTDEEAVRKLQTDLNIHLGFDWPDLFALLSKPYPEPYLFAMCKSSRSKELWPRLPRFTAGTDGTPGGLRICRVQTR